MSSTPCTGVYDCAHETQGPVREAGQNNKSMPQMLANAIEESYHIKAQSSFLIPTLHLSLTNICLEQGLQTKFLPTLSLPAPNSQLSEINEQSLLL